MQNMEVNIRIQRIINIERQFNFEINIYEKKKKESSVKVKSE